jgi:hypothetical protein
MTRFVFSTVAAVLLAVGGAIHADSPAATTAPTTAPALPIDDAKFQAAVRTLAADSWKERQAAQDQLVSFGEAAIPHLRKLVETADDEEIRTRAAAALRQIEENAVVGPSTVSLKFKDAPAQKVFDELARQAHTEFATMPPEMWKNNATRLSVDLDRVSFWTAFREVCQKTGIYPQQFGNERKMTLQQSPGNPYFSGPGVTSGPFLIVANRIYRSNSVDLGNPGNVQHDFNISLAVFAEPKLKVVQSTYNVNVEEAVDDKGNSLVSNDRMYAGMNASQQWMWNVSARLNYPENAGKTIARIKGSLKFLVQTKSETLDVPDILTVKNLNKTVAKRRMLIKEVKKNGEQYEVAMTIYRDGLSPAQWSAVLNPGYTVRLLDKEGRPLTSSGWGGGSNDQEANYTWNFNRNVWNGQQTKLGEPHRLVWEIPTETRELEARFEFKDLPLP